MRGGEVGFGGGRGTTRCDRNGEVVDVCVGGSRVSILVRRSPARQVFRRYLVWSWYRSALNSTNKLMFGP